MCDGTSVSGYLFSTTDHLEVMYIEELGTIFSPLRIYDCRSEHLVPKSQCEIYRLSCEVQPTYPNSDF